MRSMMKLMGTPEFLVGIGIAAVAPIIIPQLTNVLRPVAVQGTKGAMDLKEKTNSILEDTRHGLEDIVGRAKKFAAGQGTMRGTNPMEDIKSMLEGLREERQNMFSEMSSLKNDIEELKSIVSNLQPNYNRN